MILVSILGDFHSSIIPISYAFREKISKHIIVYDDARGDVEEAKRILRGQKAFLQTGAADYEVVEERIDEDSFASLMRCVAHIKQHADSYGDIHLNTTDGLTSVSLVLSSHLLEAGAKAIAYDRYANTYNLHTAQSMQKHAIEDSMDIRTHLMLKGYTLLDAADEDVLAGRKAHVLSLAEDLDRYKAFAFLLQKRRYDEIAGYSDYKTHLEAIGNTSQSFIQGTVFEEYIYHLVTENFDFDDVMCNVKVAYDEVVENEFDILMIKENHLHTIECKLVAGLKGESIVYKTETIIDHLDDDGRAMILSIGAENVRYTKSGKKRMQFTKGDHARAKYAGIAVHQAKSFDEEAFLDDVASWFGVKKN